MAQVLVGKWGFLWAMRRQIVLRDDLPRNTRPVQHFTPTLNDLDFMTVHILTPDDHVFSMNRVAARMGFLSLGAEVRMFTPDSFDELELNEGDIVVGGVGFAQKGMRRLGLTVPVIDSIPDPLMPFAGRRVWQSTMKELRARVSAGETIFAKPRPDRLKLFTGQLFSSFRDLIPTAHIPDEEPVDCADPITLLTEYRCFVLRGDVIDIRSYTGEPLRFPDPGVIADAVKAYADGPMGYALDGGVTDDGRTVVIEVNDGYAIGAYGLAPIQYANLITARWDEIRKDSHGSG